MLVPLEMLHAGEWADVTEVTGDLEVHSSLVVAEWRAGESRWFGGRVLHRLRREPQGLRIVLKRVDLIDSEAPHRSLAVPF